MHLLDDDDDDDDFLLIAITNWHMIDAILHRTFIGSGSATFSRSNYNLRTGKLTEKSTEQRQEPITNSIYI